jgi:hypothetical protein
VVLIMNSEVLIRIVKSIWLGVVCVWRPKAACSEMCSGDDLRIL